MKHPEGKSIIDLAGEHKGIFPVGETRFIKFTAETRCSGLDFEQYMQYVKELADAIKSICEFKLVMLTQMKVQARVRNIASNGGTPLMVSKNEVVQGVIELQDIIKPGIQERFERLKRNGH